MPLVVESVRIALKGPHPLADAIREYGISKAAREAKISKPLLIWFVSGARNDARYKSAGLSIDNVRAVAALVGYRIEMGFKCRRMTDAELLQPKES